MLTFTPKEREIMLHRLGVPEAIAEALTDHCEGEQPVSDLPPGLLEATADTLRHGLERGDDLDATALDQPGVRDILADCVDGSTFYAGVEMDLTIRKAGAIQVMERLKAKLEAAGCTVGDIPIG
jgi:hypothetical protein